MQFIRTDRTWTLAVLGALILQLPTIGDDDLGVAKQVDALFEAAWKDKGIEPTPLSSESEFLRRVSLDLNGVIPPVGVARQYAQSQAKNRTELIDDLIGSPRFATHLANTFRDIILPASATATNQGSRGLQQWLRRQFVNDMRYDRIVSDFLSSTGSIEDGPAAFYQALEFKPEKLGATTSRVFLGMQLECAQCHDHPFDNWTQKDFWGFAAFFAQIQTPNNNRMQRNFRLVDLDQGDVKLPDTDEVIAPKYPRGELANPEDGGSRRIQLSIWMASRDNPFLAKAAVNRIWAMMFGKGLVNPVDDLGPHNPPILPEVMEVLTKHFVKSGFQLKSLIRTIANTKTYQRSSVVTDQESDANLFERMPVKALTPDQLFDSLAQALIVPTSTISIQARAQFVNRMSQVSNDRTEYAAGIQQALNLMNGMQIDGATKGKHGGLLSGLEAPFLDDQERLNVLFLATLSRFPKENERDVFSDYLSEAKNADERTAAIGDILWALVTSAEFQLNH